MVTSRNVDSKTHYGNLVWLFYLIRTNKMANVMLKMLDGFPRCLMNRHFQVRILLMTAGF